MKKLIILVLLASFNLNSFGQGYFRLSGTARGVWDVFTAANGGSPKLGATMNVTFLLGPTSSTPQILSSIGFCTSTQAANLFNSTAAWYSILNDPNFHLVADANTSLPIIVSCGANGSWFYTTTGGSSSIPLMNTSPGTYNLYVIAWDKSYATPASAASGRSAVGWSCVFEYTATDSNGTPPTIASSGFSPFAVYYGTHDSSFLPSILVQPQGQAVLGGTTNVTFHVVATGQDPLYYQWQFNRNNLNGATGTNYMLPVVSTNDAGDYTVIVTNSYGSVTSSVAVLVVEYPPFITAQPLSQTVNFSDIVSFSTLAPGVPTPTFQWSLNGTNIANATNSIFTLQQTKQKDLGLYSVLASNSIGTATSDSATLSMHPFLSSPFAGVVAVWGRDATLSASAGGTGPFTYQWLMNGAAITDATNQTLTLSSIQFTNAGLYSLVVTSPFGSATNSPAQVVVNPADLSLGMYPGLSIGGVVGYSYIIQSAPNLSATNAWLTMTNLTLQQTQQLWIDSSINTYDPANPRRFYRVQPQQ